MLATSLHVLNSVQVNFLARGDIELIVALCDLLNAAWLTFTAPYVYAVEAVREPPDPEDICILLTVFAVVTGVWRIVGLHYGWIKLPPDKDNDTDDDDGTCESETCDCSHDTSASKPKVVLATIKAFLADEGSNSPISFDSDSMTMVCDNSATGHIFNVRSLFKNLRPVTTEAVITVSGADNYPEGVGDVEVTWKDDEGVKHTYVLEGAYYFPSSPVNLISVTAFAIKSSAKSSKIIEVALQSQNRRNLRQELSISL